MKQLRLSIVKKALHRSWRYMLATLVVFGSQANSNRLSAQDSSLFDPGIFNEAESMLNINVVELEVQLKKGLRVFLPEQEQFLDRVLVAVNDRRISRSMVNIIYVWSLRRNPRVPFPYFEFVMRELAKQRGVNL
jgi:hypothetical protein